MGEEKVRVQLSHWSPRASWRLWKSEGGSAFRCCGRGSKGLGGILHRSCSQGKFPRRIGQRGTCIEPMQGRSAIARTGIDCTTAAYLSHPWQ
jgi:hypothetical protein